MVYQARMFCQRTTESFWPQLSAVSVEHCGFVASCRKHAEILPFLLPNVGFWYRILILVCNISAIVPHKRRALYSPCFDGASAGFFFSILAFLRTVCGVSG